MWATEDPTWATWLLEPAPWISQASCRGAGPAEFVPETEGLPNRRARVSEPPYWRTLCPSCPVHIECLREGIRTEASGWWGGALLHRGRLVQPDGHVTPVGSPQRHGSPGRH